MREFETEYRESFPAYSYDGDAFGRLQPGAMLRFAQQISIDQCKGVGLDTEFYRQTHTAFLLARQTLVFDREVPARGKYTLVTRPCGMKRASFRRFTEFRSPAGERVAALDSIWMLVDTDSMRILRRQPEAYSFIRWPEDIGDSPLEMKLERTEALEDCGECRAVYTICDENGHINNTRYADIFLDALPPETLRENRPARLTLYYHHETPLGASFRLRRGLVRENLWYFCGQRDGLNCVEGIVELAPAGE